MVVSFSVAGGIDSEDLFVRDEVFCIIDLIPVVILRALNLEFSEVVELTELDESLLRFTSLSSELLESFLEIFNLSSELLESFLEIFNLSRELLESFLSLDSLLRELFESFFGVAISCSSLTSDSFSKV